MKIGIIFFSGCLYISVYIPIGFDFIFIILFLPVMSLSILSSDILVSTLFLKPCLSWSSNRSSAFNYILHTLLHPVLITCPYHLNLPLLMKLVICLSPTNFLNSSLVLSFMETPHIHLIICISQALSQHQLAGT